MSKIISCQLIQFKNYTNESFEFHPNVNALVGNNGMGKTNLLDALHVLSFTKSRYLYQDRMIIQDEKDFFRLVGRFQENESAHEVVFKYPRGGPKEIILDGQRMERSSDYIGQIPMIFLAPDDEKIIFGGSLERRKLLDKSISQFDKTYLLALMSYNKLLNHRNQVLQEAIGPPDALLLDSIDQKLGPLGDQIMQRRKTFLAKLSPLTIQHYQEIAKAEEFIELSFEVGFGHSNFHSTLLQNRSLDIKAQRTTEGVHRDDILFEINNLPFKKYGSQGQIKSLLLAVRFAQLDIIKNEISKEPILIIDDIFDKLDVDRINHLLNYFKSNPQRQFFVSYTNKELIAKLFESHHLSFKIFNIQSGSIVDEKTQ